MICLFDRFPVLGQTLPHVDLGEFPTPVRKLVSLGDLLGIRSLYVKDDGVSAPLYGGSKVRKLEFLLGGALRNGAKTVLTFGYAGSNHAATTAFYGDRLGLRTVSMLLPQPPADYVRTNLLLQLASGTELRPCSSAGTLLLDALRVLAAHRMKDGRFPEIIFPGGSSPAGIAGFVNAAFELKQQVEAGILPAPDCIYIAAGTMGTAAGLLLGLRAAGLPTEVMAISVLPGKYVNADRLAAICRRANAFLRRNDGAFPVVDMSGRQFHVRSGFVGTGYAAPTPGGIEAIRLTRETEGIALEGTYTGKTMAALLADARSGALDGKTVLFWNTFNGRPVENAVAGQNYRDLPAPLHRYFEDPPEGTPG